MHGWLKDEADFWLFVGCFYLTGIAAGFAGVIWLMTN